MSRKSTKTKSLKLESLEKRELFCAGPACGQAAPGSDSFSVLVHEDGGHYGNAHVEIKGTVGHDNMVVRSASGATGILEVVDGNKNQVVATLDLESYPNYNQVPPEITIKGLSGNDRIDLDGYRDDYTDAYIMSHLSRVTVDGGLGNDLIDARGVDAALTLIGGPKQQVYQTFTDNDTIYGGEGNDTIKGGYGHDFLSAKGGNDRVYGGVGHDQLHGGNGNDSLYGGSGNDTLMGNRGVDRLYGEADDDNLFGGDHTDYLYGGYGRDKMFGNGGSDYLYAVDRDFDEVYGGSGYDFLYGDWFDLKRQ